MSRDGKVDDLFRDKRATISLGYIGLYEVATRFFGPDWETDQEAKAFTIDIVKKLYQHTQDWATNTATTSPSTPHRVRV